MHRIAHDRARERCRRPPVVGRAARTGTLALAVALAAGCHTGARGAAATATVPVSRGNIVTTVQAPSIVVPIEAIDVRSKASGEVIALPAQVGQQVKPGDLLARIDPRNARDDYVQARSALQAAQSGMRIAQTQYDRARALAAQGVITAPELDSARVTWADAQAQLAAAKTNLELARIAVEDVTIHAPAAGTVIERDVSPGQIISATTGSIGAGTVLLTLADLGTVYDSTLVSESDIGGVHPGDPVSVSLESYPNRTFRGVVAKIEPEATVQQSVTLFPVLVRLANPAGLLMPGMTGTATITVAAHDDVVLVPRDVVHSGADAVATARALGVSPAAVQQALGARVDAATAAAASGAGVVFVAASSGARGAARFQPARVELGASDAADVQVLAGLRPGEMVAGGGGTEGPPAR